MILNTIGNHIKAYKLSHGLKISKKFYLRQQSLSSERFFFKIAHVIISSKTLEQPTKQN